MRQAILFYTVIGIFIATAVVTLLGVAGVISIQQTQLTVLVGALLVEVAAAVVALYRQTDFFARPTENLATALGEGFAALDRVSDEIVSTIENQPLDSTPPRFLIQHFGNSVVAYQRMQVLDGKQLEQLPKEQRDLIRTYEKSMKALTQEWEKLKRSGDLQLDQSVRQRSLELLRGAKDDLIGILDFLQAQGIYLDDHYLTVRYLVSKL
jgi:hypothetical protein